MKPRNTPLHLPLTTQDLRSNIRNLYLLDSIFSKLRQNLLTAGLLQGLYMWLILLVVESLHIIFVIVAERLVELGSVALVVGVGVAAVDGGEFLDGGDGVGHVEF